MPPGLLSGSAYSSVSSGSRQSGPSFRRSSRPGSPPAPRALEGSGASNSVTAVTVERRVEPRVPAGGLGQDHRHAVVDRPREVVRLAGDDRAARRCRRSRARRSRTARRPASEKCTRPARLLRVLRLLPLVPAVGQHQAAVLRLLRRGRGTRGARAGVSARALIIWKRGLASLRPARDQAPAQLLHAPAVLVIDRGQHLLRRRDVEALEAVVRLRLRRRRAAAAIRLELVRPSCRVAVAPAHPGKGNPSTA